MSAARTLAEKDPWPALPLEAWKETYATLHLWTQVVGKIRMELSPTQNHWWHVTLYISARGLTTSPIPYRGRIFEMEFDLIGHRLLVRANDGAEAAVPLQPMAVADFYTAVMDVLRAMEIKVRINTLPSELSNPIRFEKDRVHETYDPVWAGRFFRVLASIYPVFQKYRGEFNGKSSPVHFFWGSFDLAVTRFSGRRAPDRTGADAVTREAYSHEVISAGFWPGMGIDGPAFYAYAAPEPPGFREARLRPEAAFYKPEMGEFLLMYDAVRQSEAPEQTLLEFLHSSYEAGAALAGWDREALERRES